MSRALKDRVSRRAFLRLAAVGGMGLAAAWVQGCSKPAQTPEATKQPAGEPAVEPSATAVPPAPAPPEKVTLRWWSYFSTSDRGGLFPTLAEEYQKEHPNVTIEQNHGAEAYNEKLTTSFATADPPELFCIQHYNWLILVAENSVLELSDWYAQSGAGERILPAAQAWCSVKGKPYGTSFDVFTNEWYYNKTLFDKYALSEPKTGDDLFAVGNALKGKVRFPVMFAGGEPWCWTGILWTMLQVQTTGITEFNEGTAKKDYHIPSLKQGLEIIQRLYKEGIIPQDTLGVTFGTDWATFATGDAGIMPECTCVQSPISQTMQGVPAEKVNMDVFKEAPLFVPEPKAKWTAGYGAVWAVPANNKVLAPTLDFLTYLSSPEVQTRFVDGSYFISSYPDTWGGIKDPVLQWGVKHLKENSSEGLLWEDFMHPRVEEAIGSAMRKLATGEGTPDQVLDAMTDAVRAI